MATYSNVVPPLPFTADVDLSTKQWFLVTTASTAGNVKLATGASSPMPLGVLVNDPKAGDEAAVQVYGTVKVSADAASAIGYGDIVTAGSDGQVLLQTSTGSAPSVGVALEALSSGSGVRIEVLLLPGLQALADNTP